MFRKLALLGVVSFAAAALGAGPAAPGGAGAPGAPGACGPDLDSNPYIALYKNRVDMAKLSVSRQQAVVQFEQSKYERDRYLYGQRAVALEELQQQEAILAVASATVHDFELRVVEAQNILNVAKARICAGQDMPICSPYDSSWQSPSPSPMPAGVSGPGGIDP